MRIIWNANEKYFEAQFSQGDQWQADKDLASEAGFQTDGPPAWIWRATKAASLTKLKLSANALPVPVVINVTREALDAYNRLRTIEDRDAELRKFVKDQKKLQRKEQERTKIAAQHEDVEIEPEYEPAHYREIPKYWATKTSISRDDLPADTLARLVRHESVIHQELWTKPIGICVICGDNLYFPEEPPMCFWCDGRGKEKFFENLLDNGENSGNIEVASGISGL
jgi:hypothetical protein